MKTTNKTADTNENELELTTWMAAELATEYGDGTRFKVGDVVWHNHVRGTFRAKQPGGGGGDTRRFTMMKRWHTWHTWFVIFVLYELAQLALGLCALYL